MKSLFLILSVALLTGCENEATKTTDETLLDSNQENDQEIVDGYDESTYVSGEEEVDGNVSDFSNEGNETINFTSGEIQDLLGIQGYVTPMEPGLNIIYSYERMENNGLLFYEIVHTEVGTTISFFSMDESLMVIDDMKFSGENGHRLQESFYNDMRDGNLAFELGHYEPIDDVMTYIPEQYFIGLRKDGQFRR